MTNSTPNNTQHKPNGNDLAKIPLWLIGAIGVVLFGLNLIGDGAEQKRLDSQKSMHDIHTRITEQQMDQQRVDFGIMKEMDDKFGSIEAHISSINTEVKNINNNLDERTHSRWTSEDQRIWSGELKLRNPSLDIPTADEIIRYRSPK